MDSYKKWWKTLNVKNDASQKEIKKAYALLIKEANKNDNHTLMLEIQQAYTEAKKQLKNQTKKTSSLVDKKTDINNSLKLEIHTYSENPNTSSYLSLPTYEGCKKILDKVYCDFSKRSKVAEWHELFNSLTLHEETIVDAFASSYFAKNYCISITVWQYLNEHFLLEDTNTTYVTLVNYPLYDDFISFKHIDNLTYQKSEEFYQYWLNAYLLFLECDYLAVINNCNKALELHNNPNLYKLKLMSEYELGLYDECLQSCEIFKAFNVDNDVLRYEANIMYKKKELKRALKTYKALAKKSKKSIFATRGKLKCYLASKRFISTFIANFNYKLTLTDLEIEYKLASPLQKLLIKLGYKKLYNWIDVISSVALSILVLISLFAALAAGAVVFIVSIPLLIIGVIVYAFVHAIIETRAEKRMKNEQ